MKIKLFLTVKGHDNSFCLVKLRSNQKYHFKLYHYGIYGKNYSNFPNTEATSNINLSLESQRVNLGTEGLYEVLEH